MNEIQRLIHEMCPDGVPMVALGEVCTKITDGSHNPPLGIDYSSFRMISSQNIFNNKLVLNDIRYLKEDDFLKENRRTEVSQGDLLLTIVGAIGRCYVVKEDDLPFTCQRSVAVLKINKSIILPEFVHECIISINSYLETQANGAAQKGLYLKQISKIQIPLPPLTIQQRIVEILDKFTSLVSSLDSEIALRQKQYEYYRNKLLSFEEGDEGVEWKKLIDIVSEDCSISYGIVQPGDDTPNGIPVVRPVDMTDNIVFNKGLKRTTKENSDAYSRTILKGGEILVCVRGTTGIVSIASQELKGCNVTRGIVPLSFKNDIETKFVFHTFKTHFIQDAIENKTNGTGLRQINIKDLKEIIFPNPPKSVQLSIVRTLDTFESLLTNLKKERELRQKQYEYYREKLLTFA